MTKDVISFGQKKAKKNQDATLWTAQEALDYTSKKNEEIKFKKMVIIYEYELNGQDKMGYVSSGVTSKSDAIGLIALHQHWACSEAVGD